MRGFNHIVLDITAYAMLGAKQRLKLYLRMFVKKVRGVA